MTLIGSRCKFRKELSRGVLIKPSNRQIFRFGIQLNFKRNNKLRLIMLLKKGSVKLVMVFIFLFVVIVLSFLIFPVTKF